MRRTVVKPRGLGGFTLFVFLHGFFDGRFRAANLDTQTGKIESAYLAAKKCLFQRYCNERLMKLEREILSIRQEASNMILELSMLESNFSSEKEKYLQTETIEERNDDVFTENMKKRRCAKKKEADENKILEMNNRETQILHRLTDIQEKLQSREFLCENEIDAVAKKLTNKFCVYGHGVLLRPIQSSFVDFFQLEKIMEPYYQIHRHCDEKLKETLKEADKNAF